MTASLNNFRAYFVVLVSIFFLAPPSSIAQVVVLNPNDTKIELTENLYSQLGIRNSISKISAFEVKSTAGNFSQLRIDGYGYSTQIGEPKLPIVKKLIEIPLHAAFNIDITFSSFTDYTLAELGLEYPIIPTQPSLSKSESPENIPFEINQDVYSIDGFLGNRLVEVKPLGIMRGLNLGRVEIAPVQYNPVKQIIRIYENLEVTIVFKDANVEETRLLKDEKNNRYFKSIGHMLFNYKESQSDDIVGESPVTYIIVSDPMFEDALQPFIDWKTQKGFRVVEAYTSDPNVGTTTASIKAWLQDFYNTPPEGCLSQSFVLFVGDVAQIPAFNGNAGEHVTDLYYCEYTNDLFPEAFYGRFSATNLDQLQAQIDKTLEYEQYTFPDPTFLDEVVMIAGADASHGTIWGNGQINYGTEYYFNAEHGLNAHIYLQPEPGGGNYSQQIQQNISDGVSYANYTAHCSPSGWADPNFLISDISALTNAHKYGLMVGNCCSSVEFQIDCFGEEMLRAPLKGALGYIGGSNSTYWDEDFWWGVGFEAITANPVYNADHLGAYDRSFHDGEGIEIGDWYITQGQMPSAGNLAVTQAGADLEEYYWEIYHLMGDPSVMIYFSQPPQTFTSYPSLMPLGSATFTVNTNPYAYVAISKDGVLHGTALADASGVAEVDLFTPVTVPGTASVVITGQNLMPFMGEVVVASPDGPYVLLDEVSVDDSFSNDNGLLDYGEQIGLNISMKNMGNQAATNVQLFLTTEDEYINVPNGMTNLGDIEANEVVSLNGAFAMLEVAIDIPDGHNIAFELEATDGTDSWISNFQITAHAPQLAFSGFTILDPSGNNNGKFDAGETVEIVLGLTNNGTADAYGASGILTSSNTFVTVNTTEPLTYGNIVPEGEALASYSVSADESTPAGQMALFNFDFNADMGITVNGEFSLVIGQIPVLIVDLDGNNNSAPEILTDIDNLGIAAEMMTEFPTDLNLYSSIFVCLGVYSDNTQLTADQGNALAAYLENGGRLYMEGGDSWFYDEPTAVHEMFGINGLSDGGGDLGTINGVAGTFTDGMSFNYTGDNNWIDQLEAIETGVPILNNFDPAYGCAVTNESENYKTIGVSFEYGGLDENTRSALMEQFLGFFNVISANTMTCTIIAQPAQICADGSSQLSVQGFGGSGNYDYLWSPAESLNNPAIANPVASPDASLMYTLTLTDALTSDQVTEEIWLEVSPRPLAPVISQIGENLISDIQFGNQWYNDQGAISGATGQTYTPAASGNYYSIVTNNFGCESPNSNVLFYQPTFINELVKQGSLRVYPNPAKNTIFVDYLVDKTDFVHLNILNAFGQSLYEQYITNFSRIGINTLSIDLLKFDAGVYYIKLQDAEKTITKKILLSN